MSAASDLKARIGVGLSENGQSSATYPAAYMKISNTRQSSSTTNQLEKAQEKWRDVTRHFGRDLFPEREFADVILAASDGQVAAHKVVLAAQSTVMRGLFLLLDLHKAKSGSSGALDRVELGDHSKVEVETFLEILYTGKSPRLADHIKAVFLLARKYQVSDLLALAEAGLYSSMKVENALDVYLLAEGEEDRQLARAVVQFIIKPVNKKAVMASDKWQSLRVDHPSIYVSLLELIVAAA